MRTNVNVLEQLLAEIVDVCKENKISLFAITKDAVRLAERELRSKKVYAIDYAIYAKDYDRLILALGAKEDRKVESFYNNPHMPGTVLRYSDETSLLYSPTEAGSFLCNGIHINVWPLIRRPSRGFKNKIINLKERLCEEKEAVKIKNYVFSAAIRQKAAILLWSVLGQKRASRKLLQTIISRSAAAKGPYTFHLPNAPIVTTTKEEIKGLPQVMVDEYGIKVFTKRTDIGRYYDNRRRMLDDHSLMSTSTSWSDYTARADSAMIPDRRRLLKLLRARERGYLRQLEEIREYWGLLQLSYERIMYHDMYSAHKNEYMNLYEQEEFEALYLKLAEYIRSLSFFAKRKQGLCFDVDLFEATLTVLIEKGKYRLAERVLSYVKLEHMENVEEYLKRHETGGVLDTALCRKRLETLNTKIHAAKEDYMSRILEIEKERFSESESDADSESETEIVLQNQEPVIVKESDGCTEVNILARNKKRDAKYKGLVSSQTIRMSSAFEDDINENTEYNDIHFIIDEEIICQQLWDDVMEHMKCLSVENEASGYLLYEDAIYFHKKLILCSVMN